MFLSDLPLTNEHSSTENLWGPPQSYASSPSVRATAASFGVGLAMWDLCSWNTFLVSSKVSQGDQERKLCDIWKEQYSVVLCEAPSLPLDLTSGGLHQVLVLGVTKCYLGVGSAIIKVLSLSLYLRHHWSWTDKRQARFVCPYGSTLQPCPNQLHSFSSQPPARTSLSKPSPRPAQRSSFSGKPWRNNAAVCLAPVLAEDWIESASLGIVLPMRGWPIENGELLEQLLNNEEF